MIEIYNEIEGSEVIKHERHQGGVGDDESVWDYYALEDGRYCIYRNGFFWEWLDAIA